MSWHDYFVGTDEGSNEQLRDAVVDAVRALQQPFAAPRTDRAPLDLLALAENMDICPEQGTPLSEVLEALGAQVFAHGVVPSHPFTVAHLHPPVTVSAAVTDLIISATNQSMDSWDQAPMATAVELRLLSWLGTQLGMPATATGVMTSGGTASNVLGITLARSRAAAALGCDVLKEGLPAQARQWRILCSNQAHFSIQRAAAQLGLGRDAVTTVATDAGGRMDLAALDAAITECRDAGLTIIAIAGTAGTTDLGAIDPLDGIAERAAAIGAWFHVDAAVAGAFVMSDHLRGLLAGIERADSVTVDFHKLWWQPFNASCLTVRDGDVFKLLRVKSQYLDRGDEPDGVINLVGRSLDTSRRFDAAKVVASLQTIGRQNFGAMLDHQHALAVYCAEHIAESDLFDLVAPAHAVTVVFDAPGYGDEAYREVQQGLLLRGEAIIGRTTILGRAALKFTFMNPLTTFAQVDELLELVAGTLRG